MYVILRFSNILASFLHILIIKLWQSAKLLLVLRVFRRKASKTWGWWTLTVVLISRSCKLNYCKWSNLTDFDQLTCVRSTWRRAQEFQCEATLEKHVKYSQSLPNLTLPPFDFWMIWLVSGAHLLGIFLWSLIVRCQRHDEKPFRLSFCCYRNFNTV